MQRQRHRLFILNATGFFIVFLMNASRPGNRREAVDTASLIRRTRNF